MENKKNEIIIDGFKITTFEPAPDGFDPLTASQSKLSYHGIHTRPDKDKEPEMYKMWHAVFSKKLHYIVPEFKKIDHKGSGGQNKKQSFGPYNKHTWSGVVVDSDPAIKPLVAINGTWNFPSLAPPTSPDGSRTPMECVAWIGIDGKDKSSDVLQVGTSYRVDNNEVEYGVWWQWSKQFGFWIKNFQATFGDQISCLICCESLTTAHVFITNLTQNLYTSFGVTADTGISLKGNCAEWIVENAEYDQGVPLADFGSLTFTGCIAFKSVPGHFPGQSNQSVNSGTGTPIDMTNILLRNGQYVSGTKTTITGPQTIKIDYR